MSDPQKAFSFRGQSPLTPWPGALSLEPAVGFAPKPSLQARIPCSPSSGPLHFFVQVYAYDRKIIVTLGSGPWQNSTTNIYKNVCWYKTAFRPILHLKLQKLRTVPYIYCSYLPDCEILLPVLIRPMLWLRLDCCFITDYYSDSGRAIGRVCVCLCVRAITLNYDLWSKSGLIKLWLPSSIIFVLFINNKLAFHWRSSVDISFSVIKHFAGRILMCNSVPSQVRGFNVVNRTTSEMFVMWSQPSVTNGVLTGYHLTITGIW